MNQVDVTKNALLKGLCRDCKYYSENMCTRIADKFLEKHLGDDVFETSDDVNYEDLLEYTKFNNSCKFWEKYPGAI